MKKPSIDEAIELHRKLWDWLAKNPGKEKHDWPEWDNYSPYEPLYNSYCFACMVSEDCATCLFEWPGMDCFDAEVRHDNEGLFAHWDDASVETLRRIALAEQIRDLKARPQQPNTMHNYV